MAHYIAFNRGVEINDWFPYIPDLRWGWGRKLPFVQTPEEYDGGEIMKLACTQCPGLTAYQQKKLTDRWVEFFSTQKLPLKFLQCCSHTPQRLFDAICCQDSLETLHLKWGSYADLSAIRKLTSLRSFQVDRATPIADLSPIGDLKNLRHLAFDNLQKVSDFSPLGRLSELEALHIGTGIVYQRIVEMDSADFLLSLPKLEYLHMPNVRIANEDSLANLNQGQFKLLCIRLEDKNIYETLKES